MIHARPRVITLCATLLLAACSATTEPSPSLKVAADKVIAVNDCQGPATSVSPAISATFQRSQIPTIDDLWADIARTTPGGFAGAMYDTETHKSTILLTDTTQAAAARVALKPIFAQMYPMFDVGSAVVRGVRWDSAQLLDWSYYLLGQHIWVGTNVTASDIDEAANRIRIDTIDSTSQVALASRLGNMALPCSLVIVGIRLPAEMLPLRVTH